MADIVIAPNGTLVGFQAKSDAAKEFIDTNVHIEPWQYMGRMFYVDHRPAQSLIEFLEAAGFTITCEH